MQSKMVAGVILQAWLLSSVGLQSAMAKVRIPTEPKCDVNWQVKKHSFEPTCIQKSLELRRDSIQI